MISLSIPSLSSECSSASTVEYFAKKLTQPQLDLEELTTQSTPLGEAITLDPEKTSELIVMT